MKKATPDCEERALRVVEAMLEEGAEVIRRQLGRETDPLVLTPDQVGTKDNVWLVIGDGYSVFVSGTVMQPGRQEEGVSPVDHLTVIHELKEQLEEMQGREVRFMEDWKSLQRTNQILSTRSLSLSDQVSALQRRVNELQVELADAVINAKNARILGF